MLDGGKFHHDMENIDCEPIFFILPHFLIFLNLISNSLLLSKYFLKWQNHLMLKILLFELRFTDCIRN